LIKPPVWTSAELDEARERAEEHFREGRHLEPLELYLEVFDEYRGIVEEFLEQTVDLTQLDEELPELLADPKKQEVFRYLSGPPVSLDDLKVLVQARSLSRGRIASDPGLVTRLSAFMRDWHDRRRFPWLTQASEADERRREAAVLATTALVAMRKIETMRRNEGKQIQERIVATQLRRANFELVPTRKATTLSRAPKEGQFCRESYLGARKADFIVGLWDERTMPLECKVSNSATNSIKRLNNDAAVKAEVWRRDFGSVQVVPAAVLSGVYKLKNLEDAQRRGLTLFWAHDLQRMVDWMHRTKPGGGSDRPPG
jgi:XamI restriction endonuclease